MKNKENTAIEEVKDNRTIIKINDEMSLICYPVDLKIEDKEFLIVILAKFIAEVHNAQRNGIEKPVQEIKMSREEIKSFLNIDDETFNERYNLKQLFGETNKDVKSSTAYKLIHGFGIYKKTPKKVGSGVLFDCIKYDKKTNEIYVSLGSYGQEFLNIKNKDGRLDNALDTSMKKYLDIATNYKEV